MHRLVTIGDSLTQGFKSGAILETNLSYPAIVAWEMGLAEDGFRYPSFNGHGGLPINLEYLLRRLDKAFGPDLNPLEVPLAAVYLRDWMDEVEDFWERGRGTEPINYSGPYHNLAVWGFEIQDAYQLTADMCRLEANRSSDDWIRQVPQNAMFRTALRVLNPAQGRGQADKAATQISRAAELARDGGIENLVVFLGANNILGTVTSLDPKESTDRDLRQVNPAKRQANFYSAAHYEQLMTELMRQVEALNANGGKVERVFWGTVPAVTIAPVTRGVGGRMDSDMGLPSPFGNRDTPQWYRRYFRYYTRPWIRDDHFSPQDDPHISGEKAMEIDATIGEYARILRRLVDAHNANRNAPDWFVVDIRWALERLAFRRYTENPSVPPPPDWSPYELPRELVDLKVDTRFLRSKKGRRVQGGLISLDGIHPSTLGYGVMAQELINVMQKEADVQFRWGDGTTPRHAPTQVDFGRLARLDTLIRALPQTLDDAWDLLVDGDQIVDAVKRAIRAFG